MRKKVELITPAEALAGQDNLSITLRAIEEKDPKEYMELRQFVDHPDLRDMEVAYRTFIKLVMRVGVPHPEFTPGLKLVLDSFRDYYKLKNERAEMAKRFRRAMKETLKRLGIDEETEKAVDRILSRVK